MKFKVQSFVKIKKCWFTPSMSIQGLGYSSLFGWWVHIFVEKFLVLCFLHYYLDLGMFCDQLLEEVYEWNGDIRTCSNPEVARFRGLNTSRHPSIQAKVLHSETLVAGWKQKGVHHYLGEKKKAHRLWESKDLYFQASKSSISSLEKRSSFSCPCSIIQPQQMGNSVSFFPPLPKHISTTPTSFPPFLGFQTGFQLCNLPGPRSIWLKNWVTGGFHSFLRVMKTPRLCSVVLFMQKKHFSGLVNSEKPKEKHGQKEILVVANPFARFKKKCLGLSLLEDA